MIIYFLIIEHFCDHYHSSSDRPSPAPGLYSNISPGWQSNASHSFANVDTLIAFALPVFKIDTFAMVIPSLSANWVTLIFRFASITSMLKMISPSICAS